RATLVAVAQAGVTKFEAGLTAIPGEQEVSTGPCTSSSTSSPILSPSISRSRDPSIPVYARTVVGRPVLADLPSEGLLVDIHEGHARSPTAMATGRLAARLRDSRYIAEVGPIAGAHRLLK